MGRREFLYNGFLSHLKHDPTSCQDALLRKVADFVSSDDTRCAFSEVLIVLNHREIDPEFSADSRL
jgi:hypothetical protein